MALDFSTRAARTAASCHMHRPACGEGWGTQEVIIQKLVVAMVSFFKNWVGGLQQIFHTNTKALAHASSTRIQGLRTTTWNVQAGISQIQGNSHFIGTRLRHINSGLRCKQQVCHRELHLRRGLTLRELERRTLSERSTKSAAWIGSHFCGIRPHASVRSKYAGEEPRFAFYFGNQVVSKWAIGGISGAHCIGGDQAPAAAT